MTATPDELYGPLFVDVQVRRIFPDNKTFVDCIPKRPPGEIVADYEKLGREQLYDEQIKEFVEANFELPPHHTPGYHTDIRDNVAEHIEELWEVLKRNADHPVPGSSQVALPNPYIVPGGRFQEVYYWDSYFTMLGLAESSKWDMIENMLDNFAFLIHAIGHIPNGNRTYFLSRSQPPYFSKMVELLAARQGDPVYLKYLDALQKEYSYWMDETAPTRHLVKMPDGSFLNRYFDQKDSPRPEAYGHELETAKTFSGDQKSLFRELRAACESGWDFSGRWCADGKTLSTTQTTQLVPVDLNCLLFHLESTLGIAYGLSGNKERSGEFEQKSAARKRAIENYLYDVKDGWYYDYHIQDHRLNNQRTIAGITPFFFGIPPQEKIGGAINMIRDFFLQDGGVVTTTVHTGQQWDWPNGWAPLQWITIKALDDYHNGELATEIARRWARLNIRVYRNTGKLMEKYDVIDTHLSAGGGEYPAQDGFGWTNGVLLKILKTYDVL